jgi:cytochrome c-type biogenesis protein CcmH/NrfG
MPFGRTAGQQKSMPNLSIPRKFVKLSAVAGLSFLALICPAGGSRPLLSLQAEKQGDPAEAHLERGLRLAQAGELQSAEGELRTAVKLRPDNAEFLSSLATILAIEEKFDESTSLFEKALKSSPSDLRSRRHLAANLWQLHRYSEAKQNLKIVLRADPADSQAKLLLGMVSEKSGDHAMAVTMLESVPDLVRAQPEAVVALAKSYYRTGELRKAADCLSALANGPLKAQGALLGAQVAGDMQDYETAESLLNAIPAEFSDGTAVRYRLAVVKFHTRQYQQSEQILQQLISSGRKNGEILRLLGWCYHQTNRDDDAIRTFRDAIELSPTDERNFLDLGELLLEQRKFVAALELANRTVNAFPTSANALVLLGSIELATERFTDALQAYSRSLSLDRSNAEGILGLARAQAGAGLGEHARRTLDEAILRFPGRAAFEVELALLLLKEKESGDSKSQVRAEQLLEAAAKHDPTLGEAQFQLGELALRRGQTALAIVHLENAVRISPESARAHFALARGYRRAGRVEDAAKETVLFEKFKKADSPSATSSPGA